MTDPIDLTTERSKRDVDAEFQCVDSEGDTFFTFFYQYSFEDKTFAVPFMARNQEEAEQRIQAMKHTAEYEGMINREMMEDG